MKLAVVSLMTGAPWGGSEELWASAAREAVRSHWGAEAILPAWPTIPDRVTELSRLGVSIARWPMSNAGLHSRLANRIRGSDLLGLVKRSQADILLVSSGSAWDPAAYPHLCDHLRGARRPYVLLVQHNHEMPLPGWVKERMAGIFEGAAGTVFVSDRNCRTSERQLGNPIPNAVVLQNPVNLPSFDAVLWPVESATARFACVARLEATAKGQDILFEAFASPEWASRDWRLTLFGEGPDRDYFGKLAAMYGIANHVEFAGQAKDIRTLWAGQELLVLPSRSEGTPLALVEAMIAGRPAVVTDVGDSARWTADGETGFVADAATTASLGRCLSRAWERRIDWKAMGERAHEVAAKRVDRSPGRTLWNHVRTVCGFAAER